MKHTWCPTKHSSSIVTPSHTKVCELILQRADDLGQRAEGPYFLLFSPSPVASAWGRTGKQIAELFLAKGWQGLTVPEYFVLQRYFSELYGDHRFYAEAEDTPKAHWIWLVDSMTDTACSVVMGKAGGLNLQACPVGNRDSRRGAIAGRVVPLKQDSGTPNQTS